LLLSAAPAGSSLSDYLEFKIRLMASAASAVKTSSRIRNGYGNPLSWDLAGAGDILGLREVASVSISI